MSRSLSRTLQGRAALDAFLSYLEPASRDQGPRTELRGHSSRSSFVNHQAVLSFLDDLVARKARHVYLGNGERLLLSQAKFRPKQGDPDIDGDEGTFGFGDWRISLDGIRIRMSGQGILEMADRWGDSVAFGSTADEGQIHGPGHDATLTGRGNRRSSHHRASITVGNIGAGRWTRMGSRPVGRISHANATTGLDRSSMRPTASSASIRIRLLAPIQGSPSSWATCRTAGQMIRGSWV